VKLVLIGGGGVRGPLFVGSCLRRLSELQIDELWLLDIRQDHLDVIAPIARELVRRSDAPMRIQASTDPRVALADAAYIVTTMRIGGDDARISDERIALAHGVLGQETTGPGGFAMATRTIPEALRYAEIAAAVAPRAWTFNFSNPAGLVTQALRDAGHERVIGICDGANGAQTHVAEHLDLDPNELEADVFGLNHLSWSPSVRHAGVDVLAPLLGDPSFRSATGLGLFDPELVASKGMWINEYLYYYYDRDSAIAEISGAAQTRGEEVKALNAELLNELRSTPNVAARLDAYYRYQRRRMSTYMPYERRGADNPRGSRTQSLARERIDDGYAGVALTAIAALSTGRATRTALNVPNEGAIDGMLPTDIVEVSCTVDAEGIAPVRIGTIPEPELALMRSVKAYERRAVEAIVTKSRGLAIDALMSHPLVLTYPLATALVDDYLAANAAFTGPWRD
jgi:6-phospho-beta-glucosidase